MTLTISAVGACYYLFVEPEGGMALAGVLFLIAFFVTGLILLAEQLLLSNIKFNSKSIWITESILLLIIVGIFLYRDREIIYQIDNTISWFVVVKDQKAELHQGNYSFPFNKKFSIPANQVLIVNPSEINEFPSSEIKGSEKWNKGYIIRRSVDIDSLDISTYIYYSYDQNLQEPQFEEIFKKVKKRIEQEFAY